MVLTCCPLHIFVSQTWLIRAISELCDMNYYGVIGRINRNTLKVNIKVSETNNNSRTVRADLKNDFWYFRIIYLVLACIHHLISWNAFLLFPLHLAEVQVTTSAIDMISPMLCHSAMLLRLESTNLHWAPLCIPSRAPHRFICQGGEIETAGGPVRRPAASGCR